MAPKPTPKFFQILVSKLLIFALRLGKMSALSRELFSLMGFYSKSLTGGCKNPQLTPAFMNIIGLTLFFSGDTLFFVTFKNARQRQRLKREKNETHRDST